MPKLPKWSSFGLNFVYFVLAFLFVESLFTGGWIKLFYWGSAESAGNAFAEFLFLFGFCMTVRVIITSRRKKI